jgi:hypothetical protein
MGEGISAPAAPGTPPDRGPVTAGPRIEPFTALGEQVLEILARRLHDNEIAEQRGEPERALMRAVLEDAIRCLVGEGRPLARRVRLVAQACTSACCHRVGTEASTSAKDSDAPSSDRAPLAVRTHVRFGGRETSGRVS